LAMPGSGLSQQPTEKMALQREAVEETLILARQALNAAGGLERSSVASFAGSLLQRQDHRLQAKALLSLIPIDRLGPDHRASIDDLYKDIAIQSEECRSEVARIRAVAAAGDDVDALSVNRLLREQTAGLDLWSLSKGTEWYGQVETGPVATGDTVRIVSVGT